MGAWWRRKPWLSPFVVLFPAVYVGQLFLCQWIGDQQKWLWSLAVQVPSVVLWPLLTAPVAWHSVAFWPVAALGAVTLVLALAFGFPLAGCAQKASVAGQYSLQDACPAGWVLYGERCHLLVARAQSWQAAAAACSWQRANLLVLDSPDAAAYFGAAVSQRGLARYWTGLQRGVQSQGNASWQALDHVPAGYRPWADPAAEAVAQGCAAALPSGALELRDCGEALPFVCHRPLMWFALEANCYEGSLPTVRPDQWATDLHFIRFADSDWMIDQTAVRSYVSEEDTYCVAPVVLRNRSLVYTHCGGYDVVATCYSNVVGQCGPAQLDACGWNYPAGGYARVYRPTAEYAEMDSDEADAYEQAAKQIPLKNQGYGRLYVSWVPQYTPYSFDQIAASEGQCVVVQWIAYGSVYGAVFGAFVLAVLLSHFCRWWRRTRRGGAVGPPLGGRRRSVTPTQMEILPDGELTPTGVANPPYPLSAQPLVQKSATMWAGKLDEPPLYDAPLTPVQSQTVPKRLEAAPSTVCLSPDSA
eukprot:EG_transcript_6181